MKEEWNIKDEKCVLLLDNFEIQLQAINYEAVHLLMYDKKNKKQLLDGKYVSEEDIHHDINLFYSYAVDLPNINLLIKIAKWYPS